MLASELRGMNMTRRFAARATLASALLVPVVAGAAPSRLPQATEAAPNQSALSFTVDPLDPQHAKLVVTDTSWRDFEPRRPFGEPDLHVYRAGGGDEGTGSLHDQW